MIPSNLIGVVLFALLIASAFGVMHWRVRRVVKFRYIVVAFAVLLVLLIAVWK